MRSRKKEQLKSFKVFKVFRFIMQTTKFISILFLSLMGTIFIFQIALQLDDVEYTTKEEYLRLKGEMDTLYKVVTEFKNKEDLYQTKINNLEQRVNAQSQVIDAIRYSPTQYTENYRYNTEIEEYPNIEEEQNNVEVFNFLETEPNEEITE